MLLRKLLSKKLIWLQAIAALAIQAMVFGTALAASDQQQIEQTLTNYIQGTSYNYPDKIVKAFYPDANLLLEKQQLPVWRVPAAEYVGWFKAENSGKFTGRIGEILNIDINGAIATAKVEILIPSKKSRFVDLFLLKKLTGNWQIISKTAEQNQTINHGERILFIVSNQEFHGTSDLPVGASFSELVIAYDTFKKAGYTVDFVSPEGGAIPLSYINTSDRLHKQYLYDADFIYALKHTRAPDEIDASRYRAVHYIGGSSAMYGVSDNQQIQKISMDIYEKHQGIVSSVCHGTAGIALLKLANGEYLVSGKKVSGYPDEYENPKRAYYQHFPFAITQTIEKHGGQFNYNERGVEHVEVDGRLVTGQNYQSSALVAEKVIELLASNADNQG